MADLSLQAAAYDTINPDNSLAMGCGWLILLLLANWCWFSSHLVNPMLWADTSDPSEPFVVGRCVWPFQILRCGQPPTSQASPLSLAVPFDIIFSQWILCCGQNFPSLGTIVTSILWACKSLVKSKLSTWNIKSKLYAWNIHPSPDWWLISYLSNLNICKKVSSKTFEKWHGRITKFAPFACTKGSYTK